MADTSSRIGKYELVRPLGRGGMGAVYLARDPDLDRFLAIKVLREQLFDQELLERFFREARAAANLRHENIITIYDIGQHDHQPYMALEYVDGKTLLDVIHSSATLPLAQRLSYVEQICAGLHFAHAAGIVHRDIKPANVMVDRRGIVRILDFGIARVQGSGMTRDGAMIGTLNYMSPEQMLGRPVDYRSDIFAVGALAYELVTNNKAFPGSIDDGLLHKLPHEEPTPLSTFCPGLPEELQPIVFRALAKRPQDRFPDLEQMRLALFDLRRNLDPELALETILVTSPRGSGGRVSSSGRSERPEFAERRARQIAVHLDAARAALGRRDIDTAAAACEDALTLAPDHPEALALLEEVERLRQQRDEESRARRDRERTVRQRVADADLRLSRGDVEGAVLTLEQALAVDPANPAGLALLPRVRESAAAAGLLLPASMAGVAHAPATESTEPPADAGASIVAGTVPVARTVVVPRQLSGDSAADAPGSRVWRPRLAAAATVIAVAATGIAWFMPVGSETDTLSTLPSRSTTADPATTPPPVQAVAPPAPVTPLPSSAPEPDAPAAPPSPPPSAPPEPEPRATPDAALAVQRQIDDVTAIYRRGDLGAALTRIEPLVDTSDDPRVRNVARTLAEAAARSMTTAAAAADVLLSAERAPDTYGAASAARSRAEQALKDGRYVEAGRVALVAADGFRRAQIESKAAAARSPVNPPPSQPDTGPAVERAASSGDGASPPLAPRAAENTAAVPANAAAAPATAPVVRGDEAGVFALLTRYQDAYRAVSLDRLLEIFPTMPRERQQSLRKDFEQLRECDVQFLSPEVRFATNDPTNATVTGLFSYSCQPKTRQPPVTYSQDEFFRIRKVGEAWLIQSTGSFDAGKR